MRNGGKLGKTAASNERKYFYKDIFNYRAIASSL